MMKPAWAISIFLLMVDAFGVAVAISAYFQRAHIDPVAIGVVILVAVVAVAIVSGTAGLRYALRSRIDPNRGYPDEPGYIPGAPQAVSLYDSSRGRPIANFIRDPKLPYERKRRELERGGWITVQLAQFRCPPLCCKCLLETTETHKLHITRLAKADIPYCGDCRRRAMRSRVMFYATAILFSAGAGFLLPVICGEKFDINISILLSITFGAVVLVVSALPSFPFPGPVKFSRFRHDLNTVRLRFPNPAYAGLIIEQGQLT